MRNNFDIRDIIIDRLTKLKENAAEREKDLESKIALTYEQLISEMRDEKEKSKLFQAAIDQTLVEVLTINLREEL
jgi:hypothetical protein